jgi:succinyl-CoA synthetase beta subunit
MSPKLWMMIRVLHCKHLPTCLKVDNRQFALQVVEAFKILNADPQVKAILVNIFGEPDTGPYKF